MSMQSSLWTPPDGVPPGPRDRMRLFALQATAELGKAIADRLGQPLSLHEEREFEDGEHKARPLDPVIGKDVYVIQSLHGGPEHERQRQALPAAVLHWRAEGCRRRARHGRGAVSRAMHARIAAPSPTTL